MSKIELFRDRAGEWRWRLKSSNGRIVAASEGYKTEAGVKRGAAALKRTAAAARVVYARRP